MTNTPFYKYVTGFTDAHSLSGMPRSTPVLIALSGGADSSLLLRLCASYREDNPHKIYAAHVNHGIRGDDADADELFCKKLCEDIDIEFFSLRANVPAIAKESGESIEGAARRVRYEFFAKIMRENSIPLLLTAHNADDNLETQIFNLARGSGLSGLSGIPRVRECEGGMLTRPILDIPKRAVLKLCSEHGIAFVTDSTNADVSYSRNRIRENIIPELEMLTASPQRSAMRCADILREDDEYLYSLAHSLLEGSSRDGKVELDAFNAAARPIRYRALKLLAAQAGLSSVEGVHCEAVFELASRAEPHSRVDLSENFCARIEHSRLYIAKRHSRSDEKFEFEQKLTAGAFHSEQGRFLLTVEKNGTPIICENPNKFKNIYNLSTEIYLNSATIKGYGFFRTKKDSDVILQNGMHKKLRKLLGERSVHPDVRARLPILCDSDGIIWAPFCALRDGAKAPSDKCDLKISLFIDDFY